MHCAAVVQKAREESPSSFRLPVFPPPVLLPSEVRTSGCLSHLHIDNRSIRSNRSDLRVYGLLLLPICTKQHISICNVLTSRKSCVRQSLQLRCILLSFLVLFFSICSFSSFPQLGFFSVQRGQIKQGMMGCLQAERDCLPVQNVRHHFRAQEA